MTWINLLCYITSIYFVMLYGIGSIRTTAKGPFSAGHKTYQVSMYGCIATIYFPVDKNYAKMMN